MVPSVCSSLFFPGVSGDDGQFDGSDGCCGGFRVVRTGVLHTERQCKLQDRFNDQKDPPQVK